MLASLQDGDGEEAHPEDYRLEPMVAEDYGVEPMVAEDYRVEPLVPEDCTVEAKDRQRLERENQKDARKKERHDEKLALFQKLFEK